MSSARRVAVGVLVSGLFIALLGFGMTRDAREIPSPLVGQPAPEFALETLLGIVYQDSRSNALEYMARRGGGWTNLMDADTRAAIDFGVYGVPETYFIDARGRITYKHVGPATDELLTERIEAMIAAGPTPPEPEPEGTNG